MALDEKDDIAHNGRVDLVPGLDGHAELARKLIKRLVLRQRILKPCDQPARQSGVGAQFHGR